MTLNFLKKVIKIKKILKNFEPLNTVKKGIIQNQSTFYSVIKIIISENIPKEEDSYFEIREKQTFSFDLKDNEFLWVSSEQSNVKYSIVNFQSSNSNSGGSNGIIGKDGLSAYEIALNNGFVGTEEEWLESLKSSYISMDGDNKRAFLNDVFTEDELEKTYTNMGKNKLMIEIEKKNSIVKVKDIIPNFNELSEGIKNIPQEIKKTFYRDEIFDEIINSFGDFTNETLKENELLIIVKYNKNAELSGKISEFTNFNFFYYNSGIGTSGNLSLNKVKVYGLNNKLLKDVNETNNQQHEVYLNYNEIKNNGLKINNDEYFKIKIEFFNNGTVNDEQYFKNVYTNFSSLDDDPFSLVCAKGSNISSFGILYHGLSSTHKSGFNNLIFIDLKKMNVSSSTFSLSYLRNRRYTSEKLRNIYIDSLDFYYEYNNGDYLLYDREIDSSNYSINDNLRDIIIPYGKFLSYFNNSSTNIINCLDRAYSISKETIFHFLNQIDPLKINKNIEIRIRNSYFLNSDDPDVELALEKMTSINLENPLIKFVI